MVELPRISEVLAPYSKFDGVPDYILRMAQERGTIIHAACASIARDLWYPPVHTDWLGYVKSYQNWLDKYVREIHLVEKTLVDEDLGFQGTPDLIVTMVDGIMTLPDLKTPNAKSSLWRGQIAAYRHLARKNNYPVEKVGSLRLREDGSPAIFDHYPLAESDFIGFHGALIAHRFFNS